jgi:hypothetical protein
MLLPDFENTEGRLAAYRILKAFVQKAFARISGVAKSPLRQASA